MADLRKTENGNNGVMGSISGARRFLGKKRREHGAQAREVISGDGDGAAMSG